MLSSAAQGVSAKLAPKYSACVIIGKHGPSTYRLKGPDGKIDEIVHVSHLKPYVAEERREAAECLETEEDDGAPRPPRDQEDPTAMSDPLPAREPAIVQAEAPARADEADRERAPAGNAAGMSGVLRRGPDRPRKNVRLVVRPVVATSEGPGTRVKAAGRPRRRPKGARNKETLQRTAPPSPRRTRTRGSGTTP